MDYTKNFLPFFLFSLGLVSFTGDLHAENEETTSESSNVQLSYGLEYSTGFYGQNDKTEMLYAPIIISYHSYPWKHKIEIPWLQIQGQDNLIRSGRDVRGYYSKTDNNRSGFQGGNNKNQNNDVVYVTTNKGLGDVVISSSYELNSMINFPWFIDLGYQLKIPTADESQGLGTGEYDISLSLGLEKSQTLKNKMQLTWFYQISYQYFGDPDYMGFNNTWKHQLGFDVQINNSWLSGISLDFQEPPYIDSDEIQELQYYVNYQINHHYSVLVSFYQDFTSSSVDKALGLQINYNY